MAYPKDEIDAQTEAYLEELRTATQSAHERLRSGLMRLRPQAPGPPRDEPMPDPEPRQTGGLVDFDFDAPIE